ncbi:MAG: tetratricopeptide repeat protein [Candidatus Omnitrophica bacterium]|nr:tetratricopeptide repeat protein [Candidatus Omnitrophota bacterium]
MEERSHHKIWSLGSGLKSIILCSFAIVFITFLSFQSVLYNDFVNWDDDVILLRNPLVRSLTVDNIIRIFKTPVLKIYCPLTILTFAFEYRFFQLNPFFYHLNNLILHLAVVWLIFYFFIQLGFNQKVAALAALIFGIHPMHVESVAWVTERKDVLYTFFYMLSLNCYLIYTHRQKKAFFYTAVLIGCLSFLSKPMAISLPLVFYLCDWFKGRKFTWRVIVEKGPLFLMLIPVTWMTLKNMEQVAYSTNIINEIVKVVWITMFYLWKFFVPLSYTMFYDIPRPFTLSGPMYFLSLIVFVLWVASMVRFRRNKVYLFANLYFILSIFFVLRRVQVHSPGAEPFYSIEDRFMYLPSLGYCLLIGSAFHHMFDAARKKGGIRILTVCNGLAFVFVYLSFLTYLQTQVWKNSLTLWDSVIAANPERAIAYNNRGVRQMDLILALSDFNLCLQIDPHFIEAYFNRANTYSKLGKPDKAIEDYTKCIQFNPLDAQAYYLRSKHYGFVGDMRHAYLDAIKARDLGFKDDGYYKQVLP